ncbi:MULTISPECIES: hypothetical protein [unclassified Nocardiopsis]|uniref:hypothetical protein n=1 Tax=unclassified Nocardiopsis TaxID=2649073 RepID=UPI001F2A83B6|nr:MULTISPECIES: hypothetical protein [unclassified Nocardiopsis]
MSSEQDPVPCGSAVRPRRERRHAVAPVTPPRLVAATTVVTAVPCVLYPLVGAWTLLWIPAVLLLLGAFWARAGGADIAAPASASGGGAPGERSPEAAARPGRGTRVRPVALPSAVGDYDLVFSAVVHWRWEGHVDLRLRNPVAPAVLAVVTRASELARGVDPADHGRAECELAARLAVETAVTGAGVVAWAEEVALRLPEEDTERLRRMAGIRKDRALRETIRDAEDELEELAFGAGPPPSPRSGRSAPAAGSGGPTGAEAGADPYQDPFEDPFGDSAEYGEDELPEPPAPGSDVDGEGYESYWWPAQGGVQESAERDVQVAILRGMIDSVGEGPGRADFARDQVEVLETAGFTEVARRIREAFPDLVPSSDPSSPDT